jgi:TonB family protein
MRCTVRFVSAALLAIGLSAISAHGEVSSDYRKCVFSVMVPDYPQEAREKKWTGLGSAALQINSRTGRVENVALTRSTGHAILDEAALRAYRRWVFLPNTISHAEVPIIFNRFGPIDPTSSTVSHPLVLNSPPVELPTEAIRQHLSGSGTVMLEVGGDGMVSKAYMVQSTGHRLLDDAAIRAYRQWRFKPGAVTKIKLPVRFLTDKKAY